MSWFKRVLLGFAVSIQSTHATPTLQPGDLLLQSQNCFVCSLIEIEEGLPYSHAGIVVTQPTGKLAVLEAWTKINQVPVQEFLNRKRAGTQTLVLRPLIKPNFKKSLNSWILSRFHADFLGRTYDTDFLWDNADENGEKYYCSEFIAKLINPALQSSLQTKRMHFNQHREYWVKYFRGNPPAGKPGMSPADFVRSGSFKSLGFVN